MPSPTGTTKFKALAFSILFIALAVALFLLKQQFSSPPPALDHIELIHRQLTVSSPALAEKSELDKIRESIDWSDAPEPAPELVRKDGFDVYTNVTMEYLTYIFDKVGYTGEKIAAGDTEAIPPLFVVSISEGWAQDHTVQLKKSIFYRVLLPLILHENDAILAIRKELLEISDSNKSQDSYTPSELEWLRKLAINYGVIKEDSDEPVSTEQIKSLINRVDMVPPSLALAQAAHESGYASSRFAHTGNALFGQWDWSESRIKPEKQREGMGDYGIKAFDQPIGSVRAYLWNLNTHRAYVNFRNERQAQRGSQQGRIVFDSNKLADTLLKYSERGSAYTGEIKQTMRHNKLGLADKVRLMQGEPVYFD